MRTRLVCILAISLSACADSNLSFASNGSSPRPLPRANRWAKRKERGSTESAARDVAWSQADGMAGATRMRFTQARIESTASVATQVVTATVYRCPPVVDLK